MTREEAKKLLPIIQAWAEGKNVQFLSDGEWHDINQADFTCYPDKYRIKTEPKYRPFKTQEECWNEMLKHQPFGWLKNKKSESTGLIGSVYTGKEVCIIWATNQEDSYNVSNVFNDYVFADGTPFGIKEK